MNTIVTFETAKLLKEKGFDLPCIYCYDKCNMLSTYSTVFKPLNYNTSGYLKSAPTIEKVVLWLYEKHGIWISVAPRFNNDNSLWFVYESLILSTNTIKTLNNNLFKGHFNEMFKSPTEAYSSAILYTLNNLMQKVELMQCKYCVCAIATLPM